MSESDDSHATPGGEDAGSATEDDERPLERRVAAALRSRDSSVAVAESCTGGHVASLLSDVPGASDYLARGFVVYTPAAKCEALAVPREALDEHGPVSYRVAQALATGARDVADTDWAVATTGYAGPDGGATGRPVGTAFVGVAHAAPWGSGDSFARATRFEFDGDRHEVKDRVARAALGELLAALDESPGREE